MLPMHRIAHDLYEERLRAAERRHRALAEQGLRPAAEPRAGAAHRRSWLAGLLAWRAARPAARGA